MQVPGCQLLSMSWVMLWFYGCCFAKVLFWGQVSTQQGSLRTPEQLAVSSSVAGWTCSSTDSDFKFPVMGSCQENEAAGLSRGACSAAVAVGGNCCSPWSSVTLTLAAGPASL